MVYLTYISESDMKRLWATEEDSVAEDIICYWKAAKDVIEKFKAHECHTENECSYLKSEGAVDVGGDAYVL